MRQTHTHYGQFRHTYTKPYVYGVWERTEEEHEKYIHTEPWMGIELTLLILIMQMLMMMMMMIMTNGNNGLASHPGGGPASFSMIPEIAPPP